MKARLIGMAVVATFAMAACGSDDDADDAGESTDTDVTEVTLAPDAEAAPSGAAGLQVTSVDFENATAVLTNTGDEPFDLSGHWVCNRPSYAELSAVVLAPGEELEIGVGGATADGGEVAIYSSDDFGNSADIVAYVHWGGGGGRAAVAEDAGIWAGEPADSSGTRIELIGEPGSAAAWE